MGRDIEARRAGVAVRVGNAGADLDLRDCVVNGGGIASGQPELGRDVAVVEQDGRQARNGVVDVGDAELAAGLGRDEVGKDVVAHAGRAIGVDVDAVTLRAESCGCERGDGTAKGVTRGDDAEARVGGDGLADGGGGGVGDFVPGVVEAVVDFAAVGKGAVGEAEDDVGDEVAEVVAAADGEDDELVGGVDGDEAANAGYRAAVWMKISVRWLLFIYIYKAKIG